LSDIEFPSPAIWPSQHRATLIVGVHVDAPELNGRLDGSSLGLDYTATGLQRILRIFDDLGIEATTAWTSSALASYPQLARLAHERGHEIAWSMATGSAAARLATAPELLERISGQTSTGYIESLPGMFAEAAISGPVGASPDTVISWVISSAGGDIPVIVQDTESEESSVQIPVSPYWMDTTWLHPQRPAPPSSLLETWTTSLASVRAEGGMITIVLHPHIAGRPGFADAIIRFLDDAIASGDVWIVRADHLALWWKSSVDANS
jgi:peptidoglycan/xylan/chitin deacetylase (PgdA/CDA1 family)